MGGETDEYTEEDGVKKIRVIEINNESNKAFWAMACITPIGHTIYIHIGTQRRQLHTGKAEKVEPGNYAQLEINEVEY